MSNYLWKNKIEKMKRMHTFYPPEFNLNDIYYNNNYDKYDNYDSHNDKNLFNKKIITNKAYIHNNISNYNEPYRNIHFIYENKNKNQSSTSNKYNNNNYNLIFKKENKYNNYRNINLNKVNSLNNNDNNEYNEYIIDYKNGLENKNFKKRKNASISNDISLKILQDQRIINNSNLTYNKICINNYIQNVNKGGTHNYDLINKNKTCNEFYNLNNSKGETLRNINEPYKKRIINDYGYNNESNKDKIKKVNINLKFSKKIEDLLSQNNNSDNNIKKDNIKYNYTTLNFNRIKNKNNTKEKIYKKTNLNSVCKKLSFKSNNEFLIKTEKFIQHLSKYCMLYYFQILKIFFSSLNHFNKYNNSRNEKYFSKSNTSNINRKIPVPSLHFNNRSTYERTINKLKGKTPSNKSCSLIVDRIRSKNESISPNKRNTCEMYRNVDELSKKCEMINNRKNRLNNSSLRKSIKNSSFNNGKKIYK